MSVQLRRQLNGVQKASILVMALDTATSAQVFKLLTEDEIEALTGEMVRLQNLDREAKLGVLAEFEQMLAAPAG